eukprot:TRINITY_DN7957_c0_g1_i1.p1 TRINITY_DN7957_c0_g1~~TRINITY_DN7957_c0_g1_i1.p1  ORF type:complete len:592 (+),score=186.53 TRINITY_DN7957_c0_g1_i1:253-1776(+)
MVIGKNEDFSGWYREVLEKAEMIEYYNVSGCYVLRPMSYSIWENIQQFFDTEIKKLGVQNAYFPLLVTAGALKKEEKHFEGFSAEVAWVTKGGSHDLAEPLAIRPTSETIMYQMYSKWIRSHRDLPLKLNQWCSVVRWEFKQPTPFLRTREFLWQEGHTAFATKPEADKEVRQILELYRQVYEEVLAIPVVLGQKTENEKFAGGLYTTTAEAFIPTNGRAIQGATSHCLGQNFAELFNIQFETDTAEKTKEKVWQNSWGLTTRTIGVLVMVHGDDKGLVLPPRVSPTQLVIVPILFKDSDTAVETRSKELHKILVDGGVRCVLDDRKNYTPGNKYAHWEMKGVPVRLEVGPKDVESNSCVLIRRDWKEGDAPETRKVVVKVENLLEEVRKLFDSVQKNMLERARKERDAQTATVTDWKDFVPALDSKKMCLIPFCDEDKCEDDIKERSGSKGGEKGGAEEEDSTGFGLKAGAKSLCKPFEHAGGVESKTCVGCGKPAKAWTLFGRSY